MPDIEHINYKGTTYDLKDTSAIHTINGVAPDENGELSTVNALSIVDGKLCITYQKEVDD